MDFHTNLMSFRASNLAKITVLSGDDIVTVSFDTIIHLFYHIKLSPNNDEHPSVLLPINGSLLPCGWLVAYSFFFLSLYSLCYSQHSLFSRGPWKFLPGFILPSELGLRVLYLLSLCVIHLFILFNTFSSEIFKRRRHFLTKQNPDDKSANQNRRSVFIPLFKFNRII